jgi:hypothetical protein
MVVAELGFEGKTVGAEISSLDPKMVLDNPGSGVDTRTTGGSG